MKGLDACLGACAVLALLFFPRAPAAAEELPEFQQATLEALAALPGAEKTSPERHRQLAGLGFAQAAVLRALATAPGMSAAMADDGLRQAAAIPITFSQAEAYSLFCRLPEISPPEALAALPVFAALESDTLKTLSVILRQDRMAPAELAAALDLLRRFSAPGHWGARAYFSHPGGTKDRLIEELWQIAALPETGGWALESCSRRADADAAGAAAMLSLLGRAAGGKDWHIRSLCADLSQALPQVQNLAATLFLLDSPGQDAAFARLPPEDKKLVLGTFHASRQWKAERMNRLHALTDAFGVEYSDTVLRQLTPDRLLEISRNLGLNLGGVQQEKMTARAAANDNDAMLRLMRQAAAVERRRTAATAATAELYILATEGDELFDSSFRDILVPELVRRLEARGGLFAFLEGIDPQRLYTDAFLGNMAQRGKLGRILPRQPGNEKRFLRLLARLAFADTEGLLTFAVALQDILPRLSAEGRIQLVREAADRAGADPELRPALLALLAFQYERQGKYLPVAARRIVERLLPDAGLRTTKISPPSPFKEWTADGRIRALSLFPPDDDGSASFVAFCRTLLANGYKARLTTDFPLAAPSTLPALTANLRANRPESLHALFRALGSGGAVDFFHRPGSVELVHTLHVIRVRESAAPVLSWFLESRIELLAQRGHSYWRRPQIVAPMTALRDNHSAQTARVLAQKRRFISLGSCGGTNAYHRIRRLFLNNADLLATVGTGDGVVNDLYNIRLPEFAARRPQASWREAAAAMEPLFRGPFGRDYLRPGDLPSVLSRNLGETTP